MLFKILKGPSSRISTDITPFHEGYAYVTEDGGDFYVDLMVNGKQERVQINPDEIPAGGTEGQILTKTANGWAWQDSAAAGDSGIETKQDKITVEGILQGDGDGNITAVETISTEYLDIPTGILKGTSTGLEAATAGTDYAAASHTHTKSEVGLGNVDNVKQYSASNPPPYPVTSVNGKTGAVGLTQDNIGEGSTYKRTHNDFTNDEKYSLAEMYEKFPALQEGVTDLKVNKQDEITGAATTIVYNNLATNRVLVSNSSGKVTVSDITATELGYLDNATSNIQTQLNNKQEKITASGILKGDGSGTVSTADEVAVDLVEVPEGLLKGGSDGSISAAVAGVDYVVPSSTSSNITAQNLVATETTPTVEYAVNWTYG